MLKDIHAAALEDVLKETFSEFFSKESSGFHIEEIPPC